MQHYKKKTTVLILSALLSHENDVFALCSTCWQYEMERIGGVFPYLRLLQINLRTKFAENMQLSWNGGAGQRLARHRM